MALFQPSVKENNAMRGTAFFPTSSFNLFRNTKEDIFVPKSRFQKYYVEFQMKKK